MKEVKKILDNEDDIIQAYKIETQSTFLRPGSCYNLESSLQILVNIAIVFKNDGVSEFTVKYLDTVVEHLSPEISTVHPEVLSIAVKKLESIMRDKPDIGIKVVAGLKVLSPLT